MLSGRKTLTEFIIGEQRRSPGATGVLTALLNGIRLSCKRISWLVGESSRGGDGTRQELDVVARDTFVRTLEWGGSLAGLACEGEPEPYLVPAPHPIGPYLLVFDPFDGFESLDVNVPAGSLFSILRVAEGVTTPTVADFLQPGTRQVAAGYAIYGPATLIVLTVGRGVNGFTLNRGFGEFHLTHPGLTIPPSAREFAVDTSNAPFWERPVQRYVDECVKGVTGPRGVDFQMRWHASLVAEMHRVLVRGGLFMVPRETREGAGDGRLRLLFEANPMAMLVEQAGGAASTGRGRILEVAPTDLDQRTPVIVGSREEVERVEHYHREHDDGVEPEFSSPLFNERSLFPPPR